ncbi:histidine phosphatase family protein [Clostridium tunisiense]|uniref:histidine phosphatase family protein n=1 Tax=Clostridium tunisiense TaxID=219748 RepID=UPI0002F253A9|nr:histidine phosphatase family protein [Clostridium tunisiense]
MVTNIYLVRHAHSTYTPDELNRPLSSNGFKATEKVTALLLGESISHIIASPYKRAIQTVEGLAKTLNLGIQIEEAFRERMLSEKPVEDFENSVMRVWQDLTFAFEGGESGLEAQLRGVKAILRILREYSGKNIAVGTHGNIMVLIMNYFNKSYGYDFWTTLEMPDIYKLSFDGEKLMEVQRIWKED